MFWSSGRSSTHNFLCRILRWESRYPVSYIDFLYRNPGTHTFLYGSLCKSSFLYRFLWITMQSYIDFFDRTFSGKIWQMIFITFSILDFLSRFTFTDLKFEKIRSVSGLNYFSHESDFFFPALNISRTFLCWIHGSSYQSIVSCMDFYGFPCNSIWIFS